MAALNFPNSPSNNDTHTENGLTFKWNGTIWKKVGPAYTDTTNLNVTGIGTIAGNFHVGGVLTYEDVKNVDSVGIVTAREGIFLPDSKKIKLGNTSASPDFTIEHNGSNGIIDTNTGDLILRSDADDIKILAEDDIVLRDNDDSTNFIHCINGAGVKLYNAGNLKLETTSSGVTVTGGIQATGSNTSITCNTTNSNITFTSSGSNANLNHYASGSNSQIKLFSTGSNSVYKLDANGSNGLGYLDGLNGVRLYHGGSFSNQKFTTTSSGVTVTGDMNISDGTGQSHYQITQTNGNTVKFGIVSGSDIELSGSSNNSMYFKTNNTERLRITSAGALRLSDTASPNDQNTDIWVASDVLNFNAYGTNGAFIFKSGSSSTERLRIDSGGRFLMGSAANSHNGGDLIQLSATSSIASIQLNRYTANAHPSYINFFKSRNASISGQTVVQDGDTLGLLAFYGSDGTDRALGAEVCAQVDGTPGSNDMPTRLVFRTSADGSQSPTEKLRITSDGKIGINEDVPQSTLHVASTSSYVDIGLSNSTSGHTGSDGANIFYNSNLELALWNRESASIRFATAGTERARIDGSGHTTFKRSFNLDSSSDNHHIREGRSWTWTSNGTSSGTVRAYLYGDSSGNLRLGSGGWDERLRINSVGNVSIGGADATPSHTAYNGSTLHLYQSGSSSVGSEIKFSTGASGHTASDGAYMAFYSDNNMYCNIREAGNWIFYTSNAERLRIDSSGRIGLGIANPGDYFSSYNRVVMGRTNDTGGMTIVSSTTSGGYISFADGTSGSQAYRGVIAYQHSGDYMTFGTDGGVERLRINSDSSMLHTRTDNTGRYDLEFRQTGGISDGNYSGIKWTQSSNGSTFLGSIAMAYSDTGRPDMVFYQRDRGGSAGSDEGFRLTRDGNLTTCETHSFSRTNAGFTARKGDSVSITRNGGCPLEVNRGSSDGPLAIWYQDNSSEGQISVSGSSVSYGGGVLTRWSQLVGISTNNKADRPSIYNGTVMSNLDEMCEWIGEENMQLNKTQVSTASGDKNVAGVFWGWDDDDDTYTNDFFVAQTGDYIIRVAGSTTVARGDLLESAGDGTAKPQSDDIVRSKTIAKVTSGIAHTTYADGSKTYPCVLMAS